MKISQLLLSSLSDKQTNKQTDVGENTSSLTEIKIGCLIANEHASAFKALNYSSGSKKSITAAVV